MINSRITFVATEYSSFVASRLTSSCLLYSTFPSVFIQKPKNTVKYRASAMFTAIMEEKPYILDIDDIILFDTVSCWQKADTGTAAAVISWRRGRGVVRRLAVSLGADCFSHISADLHCCCCCSRRLTAPQRGVY